MYEREHQGQIGVRSGSDDDSDDNGDNNYDDDYDDDAYTDTKAVLMMLPAIMIVGMNDGVNFYLNELQCSEFLVHSKRTTIMVVVMMLMATMRTTMMTTTI